MNGGSKQDDESLTTKLVRLEKRANDLEEYLKRAEGYDELPQKTVTSLLSATKQLSLNGRELAHTLDKLIDTTGETLGAIHPLIPHLEKIRDREQMNENLRRLFEKRWREGHDVAFSRGDDTLQRIPMTS